jgi:adenylate cyclase
MHCWGFPLPRGLFQEEQLDAARCALEIQRDMVQNNADIPQDRRIQFRIGIHVGDIIFDETDIFGEGVNIAARLEGIAEPGGVCISDDALRQIRGKVEIACDDMGMQNLKNITEPMRAWRVKLGVSASTSTRPSTDAAPPLALPDKPSIAVLPFQNMSGDREQEYFADGIAEDELTTLSKIQELMVIARNSSFVFRADKGHTRNRPNTWRPVCAGRERAQGRQSSEIGGTVDRQPERQPRVGGPFRGPTR